MDLLSSMTGSQLFTRDIPKIADSLERIADILSRAEQLLEYQIKNPEGNQEVSSKFPSELGTPPWEDEKESSENGDN